jgi:ATP-dependent Clp protease protease subunit
MAFWPYARDLDDTGRERVSDLMTRLLEERIVLVYGEINDDMAASITSQLLFLEQQDPDADITMYINSPGGSVTAGMAIYDTMNFIRPHVKTIALGIAASMAAFLLCSGTKGKRYALPNSEIMIHQPLGGVQGQATEIEIVYKNISRIKKRIYDIIAKNTGQSYETVDKACDRDNYLTAEEALKFGLVDKIMERNEDKEAA